MRTVVRSNAASRLDLGVALGEQHHHVLIVGTGAHFSAMVSELADLDATISVICKTATFFRLREDHDYRYVVGIKPGEGVAEWLSAADFVHRRRPVTRILSMVDTELHVAALIAESLGVEWHSADTIAAVHTKPALRQRLRDTGVDAVPFARVGTPQEVREFGRLHGWPVIIKPAEGTGSIGVTKVLGPDEAEDAFARAEEPTPVTGGGVFVEKFLEGPQYSVETFSEDGLHQVVAITKKYSDPHFMIEIGHSLPAAVDDGVARSIAEYVEQVFDAVGIRFGPTCTELVLTADGPRVFESQMRLAGDETVELIRTALDVDIMRFTVRQALGERVLPELRHALAVAARTPKAAAVWFAFPDVDGVVRDVSGVSTARSVPGVVTVETEVPADGRVQRLKNSWHRYAYVIAEGVDSDVAAETARTAAGQISFTVELRGDNQTWV